MDSPADILRKLLDSAPTGVTVVDTSPRDGLQSQALCLSPLQRAAWVSSLLDAGVPEVEAGSFVHPGRVPQMAGTAEVLALLGEERADRLWVLAPNTRGLEEALAAGARNIVLLASATEEHSTANLGRPVRGVLRELAEQCTTARNSRTRLRVAVSMAWVPGDAAHVGRDVVPLCRELRAMGFEDVTLCDTAGGASPKEIAELVAEVLPLFGAQAVGLHLHDPFGFGAASALAGLLAGVSRFESSLGGLGGCPFLPGASGNLATESLVRLLHGLGVTTGVRDQALDPIRERCFGWLAEGGPCTV